MKSLGIQKLHQGGRLANFHETLSLIPWHIHVLITYLEYFHPLLRFNQQYDHQKDEQCDILWVVLSIKTSVNWVLSESTGPDIVLGQDKEGMLLFLTGENKQHLVVLANQSRRGREVLDKSLCVRC